jgi:hypothetical protein
MPNGEGRLHPAWRGIKLMVACTGALRDEPVGKYQESGDACHPCLE